jgi:4-amino-4-deoxy-L-arabinose transferase-like glycosyltransferase
LLAAITLAVLLPFAGKAVHTDDPLFIWTARQIRAHPLDFYGFQLNWEGWVEPMSSVTQNPPLASYWLAVVGSLAGFGETAMHVGFALAALAAVLGTVRLARRLCGHPFWAAAGVVASPIFVVSSTSLMCDTMMLAWWVWALCLWIEGLDHGSWPRLVASALLVGAASLTKYFGVSLIPLLAVYAWLDHRPVRAWLPCLALPVAVLAAFQAWTIYLYGHDLLLNAVAYATRLQVGGALPSKILAALAFTGGGMAALLFAAPVLWPPRLLAIGLGATGAVAVLAVAMGQVGQLTLVGAGGIRWSLVLQLATWTVPGASALVLVVDDWRRHRTPASALLGLWVVGTLVFTSVLNWTVSGRNILPLLPAVSLLVVRRLEARSHAHVDRLWIPFALSLGLAMLVARADWQWAESARLAAETIRQRAGTTPIRFEGHWGFQYYMEQGAAVALDRMRFELVPGDLIVVPGNNSYLFPLPGERVQPAFMLEADMSRGLATMSGAVGAGYYSDGWGPMPFVFGSIPPDQYMVFRVR